MLVFRWVKLTIKQHLLKGTYWCMLLCIPILLYLCQNVILVSAENTNVAISGVNGTYGEQLANNLSQRDGVWNFYFVKSQDQLVKEVGSGKAECGFILSPDFEQKMQLRDYKNLLSYVSSPATTKGSIVKETVYSEFFTIQSDLIMEDEIKNGRLFYRTDDEIINQVKQSSHQIVKGDEVFSLNYINEDAARHKHQDVQPSITSKFFLHLLLFIGLLSAIRMFDQNLMGIKKCLNTRKQFVFCSIQTFVPLLGTALVGYVYLVLTNELTSWWKALGGLIIFLVVLSLWVLIIQHLFKQKLTYISCVLPIFIMVVLMNFETFVPAWSVLKWLTPIPYYLI